MGTRWVTLDTFLSLPFVLRFYICIHMSGQSPAPAPPRGNWRLAKLPFSVNQYDAPLEAFIFPN